MRKLWIRRKAVSTMIGGVIVLSLFLTALVSMVFVSQQYDQYQTQASRMSQFDVQGFSEYLVADPPGLTLVTSSTVPGWGSGCGTTYNCYNMTVDNLGGVGVQIVRIYINSTESGCTSLCALNPTLTITSYAFNQANSFLNPGEVNHVLVLALPADVALPNPPNAFPMNTIFVATIRGNVFSFQWPMEPQATPSGAAFSSGLLKVAYQRIPPASSGYYDSSKEPGLGGTGTLGQGYCHQEPLSDSTPGPGYPSNYAEILTVSGVTGGKLYFVNPWVTETILQSTVNSGTTAETQMYIYTVVKNILNTTMTVTNGTIDLMWFSTNHLDGVLYGLYYQTHDDPQAKFYPVTSPLPGIEKGAIFYAIFKMNQMQLDYPPSHSSSYPKSVMFWGGASLSTTSKDESYFSGTVLVSGFWVRASC